MHDRIQEAGLFADSGRQRAAAHLRIGRLLTAQTPREEHAIFEIVNQLNRGAVLITSRGEREQLAELNLLAGKRAKASAGIRLGAELSGRRRGNAAGASWERQHDLIFDWNCTGLNASSSPVRWRKPSSA